MDVELQILKHLKRDAQPTVAIIERYGEAYNDLFPEVRSYECFKYLHQGIISPIKRKSLPEIAKIVGINSYQSLHHFLAKSPWSVEELKARRLTLTLEVLKEQKSVRANRWCEFERIFSDQTSETRYIREIIFGKRSSRTYWEITTDSETMPDNSTSFVMTNIQEKRSRIKKILGNLYGLRTWVEYSFRQCKQELGWTDYKFTNFNEINKWWEIILSSYLMISLNTQAFLSLNSPNAPNHDKKHETIDWTSHPQWNHQTGWKNVLNNFRLIIQPSLLLWLIFPWLNIFPNSSLL